MEENHRQKLGKNKAKPDFWPHNCGISISSSHVLASSYLISSCSNCAKPFLLLFLACRWFDPMSTELRKGTPCMIRVALFGAETILMGLASTSSCSSSLPPLVWMIYFIDQSYTYFGRRLAKNGYGYKYRLSKLLIHWTISKEGHFFLQSRKWSSLLVEAEITSRIIVDFACLIPSRLVMALESSQLWHLHAGTCSQSFLSSKERSTDESSCITSKGLLGNGLNHRRIGSERCRRFGCWHKSHGKQKGPPQTFRLNFGAIT